jgi:hypothetical protein
MPSTPCGADCGGLIVNNSGAECMLYDNTLYISGTLGCAYNEASGQCIMDTSACVGAGTNPGEMFGACTGTGQGTCVAGLLCDPATESGNYCFRSCMGVQDTTTCVDLNGTPGICLNKVDGDGGLCFKKTVERDESCLTLDFEYCIDAAHECKASALDDTGDLVGYRCKAFCDGEDIGQQGDCLSGETCIADPTGLVSVESGSTGDFLACTSDSVCDTATGYSCIALSDGDYCGKPLAVCGTTAPILGSFSVSSRENFLANTTNICNPWNDHVYCTISGTSADAAEGAENAFAYCYEWDLMELTGEDTIGGTCIAICEGDEADDPDDNCGAGYTCQTPAADEALFVSTQKDSGGTNTIPCSEGDNSNCDESAGYACYQLTDNAFLCSKPIKMCASTDA